MKTFLISKLISVYTLSKPTFLGLFKVLSSIKLFTISATLAIIKTAFEKDHIISYPLMLQLVIFFLLDTGLGVWSALKKNELSAKIFLEKWATKLVIYWVISKIAEGLSTIQYGEWSGNVVISLILVKEALSMSNHIEIIRPGTLPAWWKKKLADYDEHGININSNPTQPQPTENK